MQTPKQTQHFFQKALQRYVIASLYVKIGDYEEALKHISKYLRMEPYSFIANKLQGECYEQLNRNDEALKSYERAIRSFDKKRRSKRASKDHNVDEVRQKVEQIRISSSSVVDRQKSFATNCESMDVETETVRHSCILHVFLTLTGFTSFVKVHPSPSASVAETNDNDARTALTFEFRVNHITSLDCDDHTETFVFRNLLWKVMVVPNRDLGAYRSLSVYLICNTGNVMTHRWSCHVDAEIRLLSMRPNQYSYVKKTRNLFTKEADAWSFPAFLSWYDVRPDRDYMRDDCITVQVDLKVVE